MILPLGLILAVMFSNCGSSKKSTTATGTAPAHADITFERNVLPVIQSRCSPCHIAGQGKKTPLDQYGNAKSDIDDMINRISKQKGEHGFMPMRGERLAENEIQILKDWKAQGLVEKN